MNLILHLPVDAEAKLREHAPPDERIAAFDAWVISHRLRYADVDDSRESIYDGRGE